MVRPWHRRLVSVLVGLLLLAVVELVADSLILHVGENQALDSVVVPCDLYRIGYNMLDSIIVSH